MKYSYRFLCISVLVLILSKVQAQQYDKFGFQWAFEMTGEINGWFDKNLFATVVDSKGNIIVSGQAHPFRSSDLDPDPTKTFNVPANFIAKYNPDGKLIWANRYPAINIFYNISLALDEKDNIYAAAWGESGDNYDQRDNSPNASIGYSGRSEDGLALWKIDSAGTFVWLEHFSGAVYQNAPYPNLIYKAGKLYLAACVDKVFNPDPINAGNEINSNVPRIVLAVYDTTASYIRSHAYGDDDTTDDYVFTPEIAVADNGNIIATGVFRGDIRFGPNADDYLYTGSKQIHDYYLVRFDNTFNVDWAFMLDEEQGFKACKIQLDQAGQIWIYGTAWGTVIFDPPANQNFETNLRHTVFLAKYSGNGSYLDHWDFGATGFSEHGDFHLYPSKSKLLITGYFDTEMNFNPKGASEIKSAGEWTPFLAEYQMDGTYLRSGIFNNDEPFAQGQSAQYGLNGDVYFRAHFVLDRPFDMDPNASDSILTNYEPGNYAIAKYSPCYTTFGKDSIADCDSVLAPSGQLYIKESGDYLDTIRNHMGCDSIIHLKVAILKDSLSTQAKACDSYTWEVNGKTYTESGLYSETYQNQYGCDSTHYLELELDPVYEYTTTTLTLSCEKDATVREYDGTGDTQNHGATDRLLSMAWTFQGTPGTARGLLDFDLDQIPAQAVIMEAKLNLYSNTNSSSADYEHRPLSGSNASYLRRVIEPWTELGVIWDNQPSTTTTNEVILPQSTSAIQDYSVDVTNLVKDMHSNPGNSHGFQLRLVTEQYYRAMIFASREANNANEHPELIVTFITDSTSTRELRQEEIACGAYTWPENGATYNQSGTYTAVYTNQYGCDSTVFLDLTVLEADSIFEDVSLCDANDYNWEGQTINTSGRYTAKYISQNGCDSVRVLDIAFNQSASSQETVSACETYTWPFSGLSYNGSGTFSHTGSTVAGCDSTVTLNLTILKNSSSSQSTSACDSYRWPVNGQTYNQTGNYQATIQNAAGCDSTITLNLTINQSREYPQTEVSCQSSYFWQETGQSYTVAGRYKKIYQGQNGCDSTRVLNLSFAQPYYNEQDIVACESYFWEGSTYTTSGFYLEEYQTYQGCDSTLAINLTINKNTSSNQEVEACNIYRWSATGQFYNQSGIYQTTLQNAAGCDSNLTLDLTINYSNLQVTRVEQCDDPYTWAENGQTYSQSGVYEETYSNQHGCDSTLRLDLTIKSSTTGEEFVSACDSYTWAADGNSYTASGDYQTTLQNAAGCDSTAILHLTINPSNSGSESVETCDVYRWEATGVEYTQSGTYQTTLQNQYGCDSLATLNLTINNSDGSSQNHEQCDGTYTWPENGETYDQSGVYTHVLQNHHGCDSTITLNLNIKRSTQSTRTTSACNSYTWDATGETFTQSGSYQTILQNAAGCDSITQLELTIYRDNTGQQDETACNFYTWQATGNTYNQSGTYQATLQNQWGCDSVATLNLTIHNSNGSSQTVETCERYTWPENGNTYFNSGNYNTVLQNQYGCDSTITLNLTIRRENGSTQNHSQCDGTYTWAENGATYNLSGVYTHVIPNQYGCDSTLTLNLNIYPSKQTQLQETQCDSFFWNTNNTWYHTSGNYQELLQTTRGCDSLVSLDLTIHPSDSVFETASACDSFAWNSNGMTYYQSGRYIHALSNENGCDSTVVLDLEIRNSNTGYEPVTACDTYTWPANGNTYNQTGVYQTTLQNAAGCDSVVTLDLTVHNSRQSTQQQTSCDTYTWPQTGLAYTTSGMYSDTIQTFQGCDSVLFLDLVILNSTQSTQQATACDIYTWPSNGNTYTQSGSYQHIVQNAAGCDSTITLNLTVLNSSSSTEQQSACNNYTWAENGQSYSASGQYTHTIPNHVGCDSVITLDLTIYSDIATTQQETACDSYTWPANGQSYSQSGLYTAKLTTVNGCDSVVSLDLSILNSSQATQQETACEEFTWHVDGNSYTQSGTYQGVIPNAAGCDSVITLNLNVLYGSASSMQNKVCGTAYYWPDADSTYRESGIHQTVIPSANGCDSTISMDLELIELDREINYDIEEIVLGRGNDSYRWYYCDDFGNCQELLGVNGNSMMPEQNGVYQVRIQKDICVDTLDLKFTGYACEQPFFIPTAFTPDGDGTNDVFQVYSRGCNVEDFEFRLFDRWGKLFFSYNDPDFIWDGKVRGKGIRPGVYSYTVSFTRMEFGQLKRGKLKGMLTVIR